MAHKHAFLDPIEGDEPVRLTMNFSGEYFRQTTQFPVIVEMWNKSTFGSGKRKFAKEFSEPEQQQLARLYKFFYGWHLRDGIPDRISLEPQTLGLIQRAANFFGTL